MNVRSLVLSADLPLSWQIAVLVVAALALVITAAEWWRSSERQVDVLVSGLVALALLAVALLRPAHVTTSYASIGPRVDVLVDQSESMSLPGTHQTRAETTATAVDTLRRSRTDIRFDVFGFGQGPATSWKKRHDEPSSDLATALATLRKRQGQRPTGIVILSDGRLTDPGPAMKSGDLKTALSNHGTPLFTVGVSARAPKDASIRDVNTTGAAVAHQAMPVTIQLACTGGLACKSIPVHLRELTQPGVTGASAHGAASMVNGSGEAQLSVTFDTVGQHLLEVSLDPPSGDAISENNSRIVTVDVTRDRVRILHVAGQPTYDVRAMRQWLKADQSLDAVAFFILRSLSNDVNATPDDLALIRFPVDELFTKHLSSFDAVILQDFDAEEYGLTPYLDNLRRYVKHGGGLIMVGGSQAFSSGGYAGSPLADALPVRLHQRSTEHTWIDLEPFRPIVTPGGESSIILQRLRSLLGNDLPQMSGTNVVDNAKPGSIVLWEHPKLVTPSGKKMPVLTLGSYGKGRTIALTVDDTHKLRFSQEAAATSGRAFGHLWDGLLGWLMRDPRYEATSVGLERPCKPGVSNDVLVRMSSGTATNVVVDLLDLRRGTSQTLEHAKTQTERAGQASFVLPALQAGGYMLQVKAKRDTLAAWKVFACGADGTELADVRPDVERLKAIAKATGGTFVMADDIAKLELPRAQRVRTHRSVAEVARPWLWALLAAMGLGAHWWLRRRAGLG